MGIIYWIGGEVGNDMNDSGGNRLGVRRYKILFICPRDSPKYPELSIYKYHPQPNPVT
jgi:hypothetical protein